MKGNNRMKRLLMSKKQEFCCGAHLNKDGEKNKVKKQQIELKGALDRCLLTVDR